MLSKAPARSPSPAPVEAPATTTTVAVAAIAADNTTTMTPSSAHKRKLVPEVADVVVVEEEAIERPKKKQATLKDRVFQDTLQSRLAEKRRLEAEQQQQKEEEERKALSDLRHAGPKYPSPNKMPYPSKILPNALARNSISSATQLESESEPQAQRGWFSRLFETISPFKKRPQTPSRADTRLPDARVGLIQLQEHARLQHQLNHNIGREIEAEEAQIRSKQAPPHEQEEAQEQTQPGSKRKRTALEDHGLPQINSPLNDISESPETRFTYTMQTPSRGPRKPQVPKSLPKQRRTYKEARAAAASKSTRNTNEPPTPVVARTAPATPHDKNNYERIRRLREIEELKIQHEAMEKKLAKLRAEQEAEAEAQPRKTKRVKIEHLKEIPHNRPGESSGSFRFPEADSDDEMTVDEDAELIDNAFDEEDTDEEPTPKHASPAKAPAQTPAKAPANPFTAPPPAASLFDKPAPKSASPLKEAASPVKTSLFSAPKAPSPVKRAPSPVKSPVKKVIDVVEIDDEAEEANNTSPAASPEPAQIFSDAPDDESDFGDFEDWPELAPRKAEEPEPSQAYKDEALAAFNKDFEQWQKTGKVIV